MHRHRSKLFETDFFKGFAMNIVNPMAIVFWLMVAGSLYGQYKGIVTPPVFAMNVILGGLISSLSVAIMTIFVKKSFSREYAAKFNEIWVSTFDYLRILVLWKSSCGGKTTYGFNSESISRSESSAALFDVFELVSLYRSNQS